jgi:murein DD-endopeptidase MepM/ murein hydrolase activator NlpD
MAKTLTVPGLCRAPNLDLQGCRRIDTVGRATRLTWARRGTRPWRNELSANVKVFGRVERGGRMSRNDRQGMTSAATAAARLSRFVHKLFPERQLHFRTDGRISFLRLSHRGQIAFVVLVALMGSWIAVSSISYVLHDRLVATKENQIANARLAYRSLLDEVAQYQRKFASLTNDLEENHVMMLGLVEQNTNLQQNLKSVASQLHNTEEERQTVVSTRERLKSDLHEIETRMGGLASRNFALRDNLDSVGGDLQSALSERNQAIFDGSRMKRQIKELGTRLASLQDSQQESVQRLTDRTIANIDDVKRVIELTGLKVATLLPKRGAGGQGGPFIAANPDGQPGDRLKANLANLSNHLDYWQSLKELAKVVPLTAPLNSYHVSSSYGKRRDPMNRRWAAHYGLDLTAPKKSTIYATAPGVITYVGWKGRYGRLIEINHGNGIKTRYGHLHKILVKRGAKVKYREKIGLVGSTGRSTGAHLHYEVMVNGKPRNPALFIKAGRHVLQD